MTDHSDPALDDIEETRHQTLAHILAEQAATEEERRDWLNRPPGPVRLHCTLSEDSRLHAKERRLAPGPSPGASQTS